MNNQDKKYLVKMLSIGWDFSIDTIYLIIFNVIIIRLMQLWGIFKPIYFWFFFLMLLYKYGKIINKLKLKLNEIKKEFNKEKGSE